MRTKIVQVGNSLGIRIPHLVLSELGLAHESEVELSTEEGRVIVSPARRPRDGWAEAFAKAGEPEGLLDAPSPTKFDERDWSW